jgi:2-polyprenyl-3-methyl-5-hydroxy-6-metoxy-1,4-benzoquinol methylase
MRSTMTSKPSDSPTFAAPRLNSSAHTPSFAERAFTAAIKASGKVLSPAVHDADLLHDFPIFPGRSAPSHPRMDDRNPMTAAQPKSGTPAGESSREATRSDSAYTEAVGWAIPCHDPYFINPIDEPLKLPPSPHDPERRVGDTIRIPGDYQHRAITQGPNIQRQWHLEKCAMLDWYFPVEAGQRVLDVGCGSEVIADAIAKRGAHVLAIDGNKDAINYGRATFGGPNLEFRLGLVDELNLPESSFDRALCLEVVEHIYEPQARALVKTLARLLKPGGKLLLTTPNYRGTWPFIEWLTDRVGPTARMDADQHVTHYTRKSLCDIVRAADLEIERIRTVSTFSPFTAALGFKVANKVASWERKVDLPFGNLLAAICTRR